MISIYRHSLTAIFALAFVFSNAQTPIAMTEAQADIRAREIIQQMSLQQKLYEMHGHGIIRFGFSHVFGKHLKPILAGGNKKLGIPATIFFDGPRGVFSNQGATAFPTTMARGASWDTDLEHRVGEAMAEEIRALGGNYSGAVCMNLLRHPAWGRAQETYGEDPHHLGEMASALVAGIQQHNVQACVKHFAANSMENNRFGGSMNMDERTLQEVYLPHFKKVIDRGAASVMSAYSKLNGEYCGHNKMLLTDILRKQWGFKGYVTSDWSYGLFDAQKGIEAGMNIEMPMGKVYKLSTLKKLLRTGKITMQQIDDLIFPVIRTKLLFASRKDEQAYPKTLVGCKAHTDLAREVAEKSAVLLKNENDLLPLDKSKVKCIAVIGSLADMKQTGDHGSSSVIPDYIVTALGGIKNYFSGTAVEILTAPNGNSDSIKAICKKADAVIIVAGTTYLDEGEFIGDFKIRDRNNPDKKSFVVKAGILGLGGDRKYLHLHPADIEAIQAAASVSKNVVVSLVAGSAVTVEEWHSKVPAIIETFYNGMEGGNALARILFGDVNPSGKLPFTTPKLESDLPPFDSFADSVHYGYYHGYSLFDKEKKEPRYPFGFGLSYTQFFVSDLKVTTEDSIRVSIKIKNTGQRAGAEVVQLYIGFPDSRADRPEKLLRGFRKIYLKAGESRILDFACPYQDLAYYHSDTKTWAVRQGEYEVLVGNSSRDEKMLKQGFEVR
ncbi:MAG: glycoside hydrolase family 3 C-terminal domain-containing protein [Chitinophagales bacterium]